MLVFSDIRRIIGTGLLGSVSGKLLLVSGAAVVALWSYAQTSHVKVEQSEQELQRAEILTRHLNLALVEIKAYRQEQIQRDQRNAFAVQSLSDDPDSTLDIPIPSSVLRVLRPPIRASPERDP